MLKLNDGRSELWQWDTGRKLTVDDECSQVHFSNKDFGRSIDVDVVDGVASIPDILLQSDKELTAWAFVGTPENGYTKISKAFKVNWRNKPADYVFTPSEQTTLGEILERLDDIEMANGGIHIGTEPPTDPNVDVWIDTDEEAPESGGGIDVTAEVGQTIVVEEVDENGKPAKWKAADYQPRTHYKELVELLPETTAAFNEDVGGYVFDSDLTFVEGETYIVKWNGVEYTCVAFSFEEEGTKFTVIGNKLVFGGDDSGEPFFFANTGTLAAMPYEPAAEVTASISGYKYIKIPMQYLPPTVHWIDAVEVDGVYEQITVTPKQTQGAIDAGLEVWLRIKKEDTTDKQLYEFHLPCVTHQIATNVRNVAFTLIFSGKVGVIPQERTVFLTWNIENGVDNIDEVINLPWVVSSGA